MKRTRLFWQLFPAFVAISAGVLLVLHFDSRSVVRNFQREEVKSELTVHATWFGDAARSLLGEGNYAALDAMAKRLGKDSRIRITVVLPSGRVVAESDGDPADMDDHRSRPEIAAALRSEEPAWFSRLSPTLHEEFLYVAYPLKAQGKVLAVVRTSRSVATVERAVGGLERRSFAAAAAVILLTVVASWWLARRISGPLMVMTAGAERIGQGDLTHRLPVIGSQEIARLAVAMNEMAAQLHEHIETVVRQQNEQDAILTSMVEGVITLDDQGRVCDLNDAAERMFQLSTKAVRGRYIQEVLRRSSLLKFVEALLASSVPRREEIVIYGDGPRYLSAYGAILRNADNKQIGVLVILREITELKRLEDVRREFVANASHELRTPLTSMRGYLETLLDEGFEDPATAERFVRIVLDETNRLNAIINDVLSLARIEKESEDRQIILEPAGVGDIVAASIAQCAEQASVRRIQLVFDCPADYSAKVHPSLLQQAIVNLIDNAIKYSPEGSEVRVEVVREGDGICIAVVDHGCGIEARHLPRLFERFYRVDPARSRQTGGTGLGLALVKHIALAHGGWAGVDSKVGEGSRFSIHLPSAS
jgi:two-component system phosphate regulon sensor histidine kinase PhoR